MFRHLLVGRVIDADLLAVQLHDDGLSCEVIGYRVMASLDRYGGLLMDQGTVGWQVVSELTSLYNNRNGVLAF